MKAKGTFKVSIQPADVSVIEQAAGIGRMIIDKTWQGEISGSSKGVMLTSSTENTGAMAYVALEKFEGAINGKIGTFYFSHNAVMTKGTTKGMKLEIEIVTNSGTGELADLKGSLTIKIDATVHLYVLNYRFDQ